MTRFYIDTEKPDRCPAWWKKFRQQMYRDVKAEGHDALEVFGLYMQKAESELSKCTGSLKYDGRGRRYVEFKDNRQATLFVIKWS